MKKTKIFILMGAMLFIMTACTNEAVPQSTTHDTAITEPEIITKPPQTAQTTLLTTQTTPLVTSSNRTEAITTPQTEQTSIPQTIPPNTTAQTIPQTSVESTNVDERAKQKIRIPEASMTTEQKDFADEVFKLTNEERVNNGLDKVKRRYDVDEAAYIRATEIPDSFEHTRPDGTRCFTVLDDFSIKFQGAGENIGEGQTSAEQVVREWMGSPGHRSNVLEERFTGLGVGVYKQNEMYYWVQMFIA